MTTDEKKIAPFILPDAVAVKFTAFMMGQYRDENVNSAGRFIDRFLSELDAQYFADIVKANTPEAIVTLIDLVGRDLSVSALAATTAAIPDQHATIVRLLKNHPRKLVAAMREATTSRDDGAYEEAKNVLLAYIDACKKTGKTQTLVDTFKLANIGEFAPSALKGPLYDLIAVSVERNDASIFQALVKDLPSEATKSILNQQAQVVDLYENPKIIGKPTEVINTSVRETTGSVKFHTSRDKPCKGFVYTPASLASDYMPLQVMIQEAVWAAQAALGGERQERRARG